jgi:hypothetical protein
MCWNLVHFYTDVLEDHTVFISWRYCHDLRVWIYTGYGFDTRFIDHLYTPLKGIITALSLSPHSTNHYMLSVFPACCVSNSLPLATAPIVVILQLPALMLLLSGEYPATELPQPTLGPHYTASGWTQQKTTTFNSFLTVVKVGCLVTAWISFPQEHLRATCYSEITVCSFTCCKQGLHLLFVSRSLTCNMSICHIIFLWNVSKHLPDYTVSHPRRL